MNTRDDGPGGRAEKPAEPTAPAGQEASRLQPGLSYRFTHAIVRTPGESVVKGLRAVDRGAPSVEAFRAEHRAYIAALEQAGLEVELLPALDAYPDSVFVEDAALCLPEGAVVLRPGAASRSGEAAAMEPVLRSYFSEVRRLDEAFTIDGGDILVTDGLVLVGLSQRTSRGGFESLKAALVDWGYEVRAVAMPAGSLHLKSDCAVLDGDCILATHALATGEDFEGFRVLLVPEAEEAAANAVRINDKLLISAGFPRTADLLSASGYDVVPLVTAEAAKLDGGLSCMSLRLWTEA